MNLNETVRMRTKVLSRILPLAVVFALMLMGMVAIAQAGPSDSGMVTHRPDTGLAVRSTPTRTPVHTPTRTATPLASRTSTATVRQTATSTHRPTSTPTATPTNTPGPSPTNTPTSAGPCRTVAFGVVGMVDIANTVFNTSVNEGLGTVGLMSALAAARASHTFIMVSLAGARSSFTNRDGSFSLTLWERQMDKFRGLDVSSYVADGTLLGDGILDEPQDPTNWGGHIVSAADIDAAAQYLHGIFPTMPAFVGSWPTWLQSTGHQWHDLNGVFAPYVARRGDVVAWKNTQIVAAMAQGLKVYMNMNATAGGATGGEMTPAELLAFGTVLVNAPQSRGMLMQAWAVDPGYWTRPDITPILGQLAALAAQRQACV